MYFTVHCRINEEISDFKRSYIGESNDSEKSHFEESDVDDQIVDDEVAQDVSNDKSYSNNDDSFESTSLSTSKIF